MSIGRNQICQHRWQIPDGEPGSLEHCSVIEGSKGRLEDVVRGIEGLAREMAV